MKRIALVLCATASLFSGVSAMDSAQQESGASFGEKAMERLESLPGYKCVSVFTVNTIPPVSVDSLVSIVLNDSADRFIDSPVGISIHSSDGSCSDIKESIDLEKYEGIELKSPLKLDYKMTKEQVISALFSAFGDDKEIKYEVFEFCIDDYKKCVEEIFKRTTNKP
ncbi:MAG: hypothetical protein IJ730_02640 [Alphaproteobacteria bacterium]|nr:hypothetical protein [Alphaproteobacteria bacterium]